MKEEFEILNKSTKELRFEKVKNRFLAKRLKRLQQKLAHNQGSRKCDGKEMDDDVVCLN